ncbi:hypothetical protein [Streptomyces sp. NPDC001381]
MDARLLLASLLAGFLALSWAVRGFVERPAAGAVKRGLERSFARVRGAGQAVTREARPRPGRM